MTLKNLLELPCYVIKHGSGISESLVKDAINDDFGLPVITVVDIYLALCLRYSEIERQKNDLIETREDTMTREIRMSCLESKQSFIESFTGKSREELLRSKL